MYYFDNAASTKVLDDAAKAALDVMLNFYANPSSIHRFGLETEEIISSCKKTLSYIFNRKKEEFIFTSGATESINLAILGICKKNNKRRKIITSSVEHKATKNCLKHLEQKGYEIVEINTKNNRFYAKDFVDAADENTLIISIMHVNNENGLILPIEEIAEKIKEKDKNIIVHIDAAQSFLKIPISLKNIDLLSACGHKINAPKGIGFLFINREISISSIMFGGEQENKIRPGTQATALIRAFEVAIKHHFKNQSKHLIQYENLKKTLLENLKNSEGIHFNFNDECVPYIVNISIEKFRSQVVLQFLEEKGFFVSSGAACSKNRKNKVLLALGYPQNIADSAIRISFGIDSKIEDIIKLAETIQLLARR